uniref:Uncharacterized protein n=1 Tax=Tanacetum cinerariifolium TaxID=118510 RepID=A0A699HQF7_TANCI|nr:hypothetical protein [Tanacetum cinerariifolium]
MIYTSCIKQFWTSAKIKTVNEDVRLQALVDGKKVIVNEASIRRDLRLDDAEGTACLPNAAIFEELARMRVLSLEQIKTNQAAKIEKLKKRVKRLEGIKKKRTHGLKRLYKGRMNDQDMFVVNDLNGDEVVVDVLVGEKEERSEKVAKKTLIEIKAANPKALTTAATTVTALAQGPTKKELSCKAKMVEPERPLKMKEQIMIDEQISRDLEAQIQADLEEEQRIAKQKEEESNIAMIAEWDNTQAMMDVDYELATKLQEEDRGELSIQEKLKLFVELINKRKKQFMMLRAEEKRRKPPTKGQKKKQMCTYLKNMAGFTHNQLKSKNYEEVQQAFNKTMDWINNFVAMNSEVVKDRAVESFKRPREELESDKSKKQKLDENVQAEVADDDTAEHKRCVEIVPEDDDGDVTIEATPLSYKSPTIVDYKIYKEGKKSYFKIIKADGNSQNYLTFRTMFKNFNREDLEVLRCIAKTRFEKTKPVNNMDNLLFQTLKTMFEHHVEDNI